MVDNLSLTIESHELNIKKDIIILEQLVASRIHNLDKTKQDKQDIVNQIWIFKYWMN